MNTTSILPLPSNASVGHFDGPKARLADAGRLSENDWRHFIDENYPAFFEIGEGGIGYERFSLKDAGFVIARSYGFESWNQFILFIENFSDKDSIVHQFETGVDAIVNGDLPSLDLLLSQNPLLIHERSMRVHRASLLHYVSANGVEDFRQKTPANILEVTARLIAAGAGIDAVLADGESTTLGLVATSIHPFKAGLQIQLLDLLLTAGANVNGIPGGWNPLTAAIANGCPEAARFLASYESELRNAILRKSENDNWSKELFNEQEELNNNNGARKLEAALAWASEMGQNNVVRLLVNNGVDLHSRVYTGLTACHWAAAGGKIKTIRLLVDLGASLEEKNFYGGTVLNQALWWPLNGKRTENYLEVIDCLLSNGAVIEPETLTWLSKQAGLTEETKIALEVILRSYGAES